MSKRYSGKSFKDSSVMKKPKLTFKEKRKLKEEKKNKKTISIRVSGFVLTYGERCHRKQFSLTTH